MKKTTNRKVIYTAAALCAAAIVSLLTFHTHGQDENDATALIRRQPIHLNDTLTNEMSSSVGKLKALDRRVERYMSYWNLKGCQLAVMRNDSLLWCKGYGLADSSGTVEMTPGNIMRVASVSKLLTAAGIMKLQEEGLLSIKDTVFGKNALLCDELYTDAIGTRMGDYSKITVEHLLRHQAGFRRDPVFSANDVRAQMHLDHCPRYEDYVKLVLSKQLRFCPGESQSYTNFGYMVLSEIIAKVSGEPYEEYIRKHILEPSGCYDMHIAGNFYEDRKVNEVRYFVHEGDGMTVSEYTGSGRIVPRCYGGNDIRLLSGAGAWVCSAAELARFVASIDGRTEVPDILNSESIRQMTEYFDENTYSLGWNDSNPEKGWNRTGTLSGTNAVIHYYPDGECWIFLSNSSTWKGPGHARYTKELFDKCRDEFSCLLPEQNLFE